MLYIAWIVILDDHGIKKISFETFNFRAPRGEKLHECVVYESLGKSLPLDPIPKYREKHVNTAQSMLYIAWTVTLGDRKIIKTSFQTFDF